MIHSEGEIWSGGTCDLFVANRQLNFDFLNHTNILCLTMLAHPKNAVRWLRLCTIVIDYTCLDGMACYIHLLSWMLSLTELWLYRICLYLCRIICSASWDISQDNIQFCSWVLKILFPKIIHSHILWIVSISELFMLLAQIRVPTRGCSHKGEAIMRSVLRGKPH